MSGRAVECWRPMSRRWEGRWESPFSCSADSAREIVIMGCIAAGVCTCECVSTHMCVHAGTAKWYPMSRASA